MKIEIDDQIFEEYKKYCKKHFLSSNDSTIKSNVEGLLIQQLRISCFPGYEINSLTESLTYHKFIFDFGLLLFGKGYDDHDILEQKILCMDINNFKNIIADHDMEYGDFILKEISKDLQRIYGPSRVYRFGGDEFIVLIGDSDISFPKVPYPVTMKYSILDIRVKRNVDNDFEMSEILQHIKRAIKMSSTEMFRIKYEK